MEKKEIDDLFKIVEDATTLARQKECLLSFARTCASYTDPFIKKAAEDAIARVELLAKEED